MNVQFRMRAEQQPRRIDQIHRALFWNELTAEQHAKCVVRYPPLFSDLYPPSSDRFGLCPEAIVIDRIGCHMQFGIRQAVRSIQLSVSRTYAKEVIYSPK